MIKELIAKLEALEEPEYYNIFGDVFLLLNPKPHERKERAEYYAWYNKNTSFTEKLRAKAWESAAIMLVPGGYKWGLEHDKDNPTAWLIRYGIFEVQYDANHPAIALLICILKAKEPVE